jgi:transcriptional regulator with XRE-family HTH domain
MPSLSVHDLGTYLREQRESARLSVRQLSELAGVSNPYLSQIERGLRKPSAEILGQLAKGLRISAESLYVRAGILEEREDQMPLETAVLADPGLTERQKRVLLDIYESFRAENARAATESTPEDVAPPAESPSEPPPKDARKAAGKDARKVSKKVSEPTTTSTKKSSQRATTRTTARASKRAAKTTMKRAAAANKSALRTTHPKEG